MSSKFKYAIILAGLMSSATSLAAPGDTVDGGTGTITLTGVITVGTCTASITGQNQTFTLGSGQISTASVGDYLISTSSNITLNSCQAVPLTATVQANNSYPGDKHVGAFTEDTNHVLGYVVGFSGEGNSVSGGATEGHLVPVDNSAATVPLAIVPAGDSYTLHINTHVVKTGDNVLPARLSTLTGSYTYTITYS